MLNTLKLQNFERIHYALHRDGDKRVVSITVIKRAFLVNVHCIIFLPNYTATAIINNISQLLHCKYLHDVISFLLIIIRQLP